MAIDLGTGDGRFVLDRAASHPEELVIGVDASLPAMRDASRRAVRSGRRNALFVAGDVALLSQEAPEMADLVTVHFPWGSLLRAALRAEAAVTRLAGPGATLRLLVSTSPRDAARGIVELDPGGVADAYYAAGFTVFVSRPATVDDAVAAGSSWGKRLLRSAADDRRAWLFELRRA